MRGIALLGVVVMLAGVFVFQRCRTPAVSEDSELEELASPDDDQALGVTGGGATPNHPARGGSLVQAYDKQLRSVLRGMRAYKRRVQDAAKYGETDVKRCGEIVTSYLFALDHLPADGKQEFMQSQVREVILRLNDLNHACAE